MDRLPNPGPPHGLPGLDLDYPLLNHPLDEPACSPRRRCLPLSGLGANLRPCEQRTVLPTREQEDLGEGPLPVLLTRA
jgi:hypothetical protein